MELGQGECLFEPQPVLALAYSASYGRDVAIAGEEITAVCSFCDLPAILQLFVFEGPCRRGDVPGVLPLGKILAATGSPDQKIKLWDAATGKEIRTLAGHTSWVYSLSFLPHGKTLASGSYDKTIRLWHSGNGEKRACPQGLTRLRWRSSVAFAPGGKTPPRKRRSHGQVVGHHHGAEARATLKGHEGGVAVRSLSL